jgi:hypothetical protein
MTTIRTVADVLPMLMLFGIGAILKRDRALGRDGGDGLRRRRVLEAYGRAQGLDRAVDLLRDRRAFPPPTPFVITVFMCPRTT